MHSLSEPLSPRSHPHRATPVVVLGALAAFVTLVLLAMQAYPGGTAWDATTRGHDFWLNYLCDLERRTALDGHANGIASTLTQTAMVVFGIGSLAFWRLLSGFFPGRPRLGHAVRALGSVAAMGAVAVGLLPADAFPSLHPVLMLAAGGPGIVATALGVAGLKVTSRWSTPAITGGSAVLVATTDLALYMRQLVVTSPAPMAIAVLERVALLLVLAWMAMVAWSAVARGPRVASPRGAKHGHGGADRGGRAPPCGCAWS